VTLLLHGALRISLPLDERHRLARHPANTGDPDEVTDAIPTMARARTALVRDADRLTAAPPHI
jgi:hypothetical protein